MSLGKICNKCGKEFDLWDNTEDFSIHKSLGYGTLYDGCKLNLTLCCKCMEEIIDSCKVSPFEDDDLQYMDNVIEGEDGYEQLTLDEISAGGDTDECV